jgi:cell division protein FtsL
MTPAAVTPAARKTSAPERKSVGPRGSAATRTSGRAAAPARPATKPGHRSPLRPGIAPRSPRRVSGPLSGLTRGRATTTQRPPASAPRRAPAPRRGRTAVTPAGASLAARAAAYVRALPDHSLLDRIIRGRVWIPLLGVLLAGIVAMQVEVLKLNAATGVSLQRTTALQNERDLLQADVARLADDQRIESIAAQMGMQMPAPSQVKFLTPGAGNNGRAVANIQAPNPTAFQSLLPGNQTTGGIDTGAAPVSASTTDPTASTGTGTTAATGTDTAAATGTTATSVAPAVTPTTTTPSVTGTTTPSGG